MINTSWHQARVKAEKNRQKAAEMFLKAAHTQRQELAQQRREEKKRAEKEKLMAEEDPDRARKLEVSVSYLTVSWTSPLITDLFHN